MKKKTLKLIMESILWILGLTALGFLIWGIIQTF